MFGSRDGWLGWNSSAFGMPARLLFWNLPQEYFALVSDVSNCEMPSFASSRSTIRRDIPFIVHWPLVLVRSSLGSRNKRLGWRGRPLPWSGTGFARSIFRQPQRRWLQPTFQSWWACRFRLLLHRRWVAGAHGQGQARDQVRIHFSFSLFLQNSVCPQQPDGQYIGDGDRGS